MSAGDPLATVITVLAGACRESGARRRARCACCRRSRASDPHASRWRRGYCPACYMRWSYHGFPPEGPPPPRRRAAPGGRDDRIEDYADLRSWGLSVAAAAARLGVSERTAWRYEAARRSAAGPLRPEKTRPDPPASRQGAGTGRKETGHDR